MQNYPTKMTLSFERDHFYPEQLFDTERLVTPNKLSIFCKALPIDWIELALEQTNKPGALVAFG